MKAQVIKAFWDMVDPEHPTYAEGDTFTGDSSRIKELEEKGFVKADKAEKAEKAEQEVTEVEVTPAPRKSTRKKG